MTKFVENVLLATILGNAIFTYVYANLPNKGFTVSTHDITLLLNAKDTFYVYNQSYLQENVQITLVKQHEQCLDLEPESFTYQAGVTENQSVVITGKSPGHVEVTATSVPDDNWLTDLLFIRVIVARSKALIYVSNVFGWIYFVAWSVSFYPQIYTNFRRKSVVGLNFDFLALNIVGFALYSLFNCGLYWVSAVQDEYENRYPRGLNPVLLNDVFFSLHAVLATSITIIQACIYERGDQRVSFTAGGLLAIFTLFVIISAGLAAGSVIHWLDFLYYCSYVKLTITIIKYVPQALMNYRRKSTVGWSIGNILLDFTGGMLSMLQMILNAYNYDDWVSIFGDPTKFGLGLFSVLFDVFFMLQHYVFYRHASESSTSDLIAEAEVQNQGRNEESENTEKIRNIT